MSYTCDRFRLAIWAPFTLPAIGSGDTYICMALELVEAAASSNDPTPNYGHLCRLPWPVDPNLSEGHLCECGRRWTYQPAHWEPLLTIEELREQQRSGQYVRSCR
jgi:hypothetical protein